MAAEVLYGDKVLLQQVHGGASVLARFHGHERGGVVEWAVGNTLAYILVRWSLELSLLQPSR